VGCSYELQKEFPKEQEPSPSYQDSYRSGTQKETVLIFKDRFPTDGVDILKRRHAGISENVPPQSLGQSGQLKVERSPVHIQRYVDVSVSDCGLFCVFPAEEEGKDAAMR